jgi:hypothetical protein
MSFFTDKMKLKSALRANGLTAKRTYSVQLICYTELNINVHIPRYFESVRRRYVERPQHPGSITTPHEHRAAGVSFWCLELPQQQTGNTRPCIIESR